MSCPDPLCTGNHRTGGSKEGLCPAALARRRANQLARYHARYKERAREARRAYYLANREQLLAKATGYYRAHRAQMIAKAIERKRLKGGVMATGRPPKPTLVGSIPIPPDLQWWKLKPSEIPRRWILEAA